MTLNSLPIFPTSKIFPKSIIIYPGTGTDESASHLNNIDKILDITAQKLNENINIKILSHQKIHVDPTFYYSFDSQLVESKLTKTTIIHNLSGNRFIYPATQHLYKNLP